MSNLSLVWLRRDLRLHDHAALAELDGPGAVVFIYDTEILDHLPHRADRRLQFIQESLSEIDDALRAMGSRLITAHGDPRILIPKIANELGANRVIASHDDDPYALSRDGTISAKVNLKTVKDHVVFQRREVVNQAGEPFRVYTPYMRAWRSQLLPTDTAEKIPNLHHLVNASSMAGQRLGVVPLENMGFETTTNWLVGGARSGQMRLTEFVHQMDDYGEMRDFPAGNHTSGLSVHLRFGTISIREAFRAALSRPGKGAQKWANELIWREFYHMILACFPHVVETSFKSDYANLHWPGSDEHFELWQAGRTGYPIVDAAIRCLTQTGWMHNRLRMVVASFLTKDLLVDWRKGERHFADYLLDFDLASNNGGWQWAASTGVDAQPYFRIFNPELQSRRFDPKGEFIREWLPELAGFSDDQIHSPAKNTLLEQIAAGCEIGVHYPAPVVDHHVQKDLAVRLLSLKQP